MLLVLVVFLEIYLLYSSRFTVLWGFTLLVYVLWYLDGSERTGRRTWDLFRNLTFWRRINPCVYHSQKECKKNKTLFIVIPNYTFMPLVWGFGLHGSRFADTLDLCYIMPNIFFKIPIVRDVLLWSGAVAKGPAGLDISQTIGNLVSKGRSVVYSPPIENGESVRVPDEHLFSFCREKRVEIVPVLVTGEEERYWQPKWAPLVRLQDFMQTLVGYPLPLIFALRIFSSTAPPRLQLMFGTCVTAARYTDGASVRAAFLEKCRALNNNGLDNRLEFI